MDVAMRGRVALAVVLLLSWPAAAAQDLSLVHPSEGAFGAALAPLRQLAEREPRNPQARYRLGYAYFTAWRQFELGLISYGRDYHRLAEAEFRAALAVAPDHLGSLLALYNLLRLRGDWRAAEELASRISELALPRTQVSAGR